jgi:hypothetical protein
MNKTIASGGIVAAEAKERGRQADSILRRFHAGYRIGTIARELQISKTEVIDNLLAKGVATIAVSNRLNAERRQREYIAGLREHVA